MIKLRRKNNNKKKMVQSRVIVALVGKHSEELKENVDMGNEAKREEQQLLGERTSIFSQSTYLFKKFDKKQPKMGKPKMASILPHSTELELLI